MPPSAPTTEVFGFSEPTVKNGEVLLPIRTVGGLGVLHGPAPLLIALARSVLTATGVPLQERKARVRGRFLAPERRAKYEAVLASWAGGHETQAAACERLGITLGSFVAWLEKRRRADRAANAPVTKPGGQLL